MSQTLNPYAKYLDGKPPLEVIEKTAATLQQLVKGVDAAKLTRPPAPGKWSVRDILCHLADTEMVFAFRLRQTVAEDHHTIQPYDQEKFAETYADRFAEEGLRAFSAFRAWNVAFVKSVTPAALSRTVTHPERGTMTFSTILETMGGHDINHLRQVERLVK